MKNYGNGWGNQEQRSRSSEDNENHNFYHTLQIERFRGQSEQQPDSRLLRTNNVRKCSGRYRYENTT